MTKPGLITRLAGSPGGALCLYALYAFIVFEWTQGAASWWMALGAVGAGLRTLPAIRRVRAYKAWRRQWKEMGAEDEPAGKACANLGRPRRTSRLFIGIAAFLLVGITFYAAQQPDGQTSTGLVAVASVAFGYLVFVGFRGMVRKARGVTALAKPETVKAAKAGEPGRATANVPVSWVMGRASSSPSREDVLKMLPGL